MDIKNGLSVIIVNYNTCDLLRNCLASVYCGQGDLSEVWVVDNGSTDCSLEMIRSEFPSVNLIVNSSNLGYGTANNQAMEKASGKYFILLNSDTILTPGALSRLMLELEKDPDVGLVGPQLHNLDRTIQPSFGKFMNMWIAFAFEFFLYKIIPVNFPIGDKIKHLQENQYRHNHDVDWISGACLAVKRDTVKKAGMLDNGLFMYGEDMEWCKRIKVAGYRIRFCADAEVIHLSRQSSRKNFDRWIISYTFGNLHFVQRYGNVFSFRFCGLLTSIGSIIRLIDWFAINLFFRNRKIECKQRISGYSKVAKVGWVVFSKGKLINPKDLHEL